MRMSKAVCGARSFLSPSLSPHSRTHRSAALDGRRELQRRLSAAGPGAWREPPARNARGLIRAESVGPIRHARQRMGMEQRCLRRDAERHSRRELALQCRQRSLRSPVFPSASGSRRQSRTAPGPRSHDRRSGAMNRPDRRVSQAVACSLTPEAYCDRGPAVVATGVSSLSGA